MTIYYDVETMPIRERSDFWIDRKKPKAPLVLMGEFDPSTVKHGQTKDPDKRKAKEDAAREAWEEKRANQKETFAKECIERYEEAFSKAALHPRTARILTIQYSVGDAPVSVLAGQEEDVIREFWKLVGNPEVKRCVNWTGRSDRSNFDLNMLYRRSLALDLFVPRIVHPLDNGYANSIWCNLTQRFIAYENWPASASLEDACVEFGIEPTYNGPVTGATFWKFWTGVAERLVDYNDEEDWSKARQRNEAEKYAHADIYDLRHLDYKLYLF